MPTHLLRRTGLALLAAGIIDAGVTIVRLDVAGPWPALIDACAVLAGISLLSGSPRAALWVRSLAVFLLAASVAVLAAALLSQPLDLTITEFRLNPGDFVAKAASMALLICVTGWVAQRLGHASVQQEMIRAGIVRWDMAIPAQAGAGLVILAGLLLWLTLHGQSAELAKSLALQQLGPDYRYHLSWISSASNGHGTTVNGVVTAWNDKEIKQVLLHWETR